MILLDCGNSQLKAQYWQRQRLRASYAGRYESDWSADLSNWLSNLDVARGYLCSVLDPERQLRLDDALDRSVDCPLQRLHSEASAAGVTNAYNEPGRLGVDRWLALIGAADSSSGDCLIIDAGSAITVDLLRADGRHLGGAILPGFNTSLQRFKQIFGHIDFTDPRITQNRDPGCSTEAAIQIDYAQDSTQQLSDLVTHWLPMLDSNPQVLISGGDACRVQTVIDVPGRVLPDLVFRGMRKLAVS